MAKWHGKNSYLGLDDGAATPTVRNIGQYCDSIELERSAGTADATTIGMDDKEFLAGLREGTLTLAGKWDDTASTGPDVVLSSALGSDTAVGFTFGPGGNGSGAVSYTGSCFVTRYNVSAPLEGVVKFTATLQISGAVDRGTF